MCSQVSIWKCPCYVQAQWEWNWGKIDFCNRFVGLEIFVKPPTVQQEYRGKDSRSTWFYLSHICAAAESTYKYLEYQWFKNQEQQVERLKEKICLCLSVGLRLGLYDWHSKRRVWLWTKFHLSVSGPHVSWPMTPHLVAVILPQWCCDLALPQFHRPLLTAGIYVEVGRIKGDRGASSLFLFSFFLPFTVNWCSNNNRNNPWRFPHGKAGAMFRIWIDKCPSYKLFFFFRYPLTVASERVLLN